MEKEMKYARVRLDPKKVLSKDGKPLELIFFTYNGYSTLIHNIHEVIDELEGIQNDLRKLR